MSQKKLIIAIDGPAGAGKSTASRELARRLGYLYVDTGAMYRVIGLLAREHGVSPSDGEALGRLAGGARIEFEVRPDGSQSVLVDGRDVTAAIRTEEVGDLASQVSTQAEVRTRLVALQREIGRKRGAVLEGRDIGTVVFPDADVKFFLEASAAERGNRRFLQLQHRGEPANLAEIVRDIEERDLRDRSRANSPLRPAPDAVTIDTTDMTLEEVVGRLLEVCRQAAPRGH